MPEERFDVAVIGAGPAGTTAATLLGRKGYAVALIDRAQFPRRAACAGWVSTKAEALFADLGLSPEGVLKQPFREITFHNIDFTKTARPRLATAAGYLVDREHFDNALLGAAVQHGATVMTGSAAVDLRLNESTVVISLADRRKVTSRLLLLATGRGSELTDRLGFPRQPGSNPLWTAQVAASHPAGPSEPRVGVVLGLDGGGSFGLCCVTQDRVVVNVNWAGERERTLAVLTEMCKAAARERVVPLDLSPAAHKAVVIRSPAAAALDMDSHVGKHTLLIGDAGGFISAASNEGIYPAMWSAKLAAKAIDAALQSDVTQDQLMGFDTLWRTQMADHLRSPHTDIRFLMPLIFQNQPMADRMAAAFFFGENL
jgi:flavin-dependent dehydrogenase